MYSSTHHAGMPLEHLVSKGTKKYWTYQQNGVRKIKPFREDLYQKRKPGQEYTVKGYVQTKNGGMAHVSKDNKLTFYHEMNDKQKKDASKFQQGNKTIVEKAKTSKPDENKHVQPRTDQGDPYQKVVFPKKFNFLNWENAVKTHFINQNKKQGQFRFLEIPENIRKSMSDGAVAWYNNKRNQILKKMRAGQNHSADMKSSKKSSIVSTHLGTEEIQSCKTKVEKIEIISFVESILKSMSGNNQRWPHDKQRSDKLNDLLGFFFTHYESKELLFADRDEKINMRPGLIIFREIVEKSKMHFTAEEDDFKALACFLHDSPNSSEEIQGMDQVSQSSMTKHLMRAMQKLKGELFKILLAHEKNKLEKQKEHRRAASAAQSLNLPPNSTVQEITNKATEMVSNQENSAVHLSSSVLFYVLYQFFLQIPSELNGKHNFELSNMTILAGIVSSGLLQPYSQMFRDCFTLTPHCNDCLDEIKKTERAHFIQSSGDMIGQALNEEH